MLCNKVEDVLAPLMISLGEPFRVTFMHYIRQFGIAPECCKAFIFRYIMHHCRSRRQLPRLFLDCLLELGKELLKDTPNVTEINGHIKDVSSNDESKKTITVVGDIHGQLDDLLNVLENPYLGDWTCTDNILIFNGDLVDRGVMSVECFAIVLLAKILFDRRVHIVRGNHESAQMNLSYGFDLEVLEKYHDRTMLQSFREVFSSLPIAAVLEKSVFLVHGGIGPKTSRMSIAELNAINRFVEPEQNSALWEILWSGTVMCIFLACFLLMSSVNRFSSLTWQFLLAYTDPVAVPGFTSTRNMPNNGFGPDITASFLALHNFSLLVRSHTESRGGYEYTHHKKLLTVFSAPNYMGNVVGQGAVAKFGTLPGMEPELCVFEAVHYREVKQLTYEMVTVQGVRYKKGVLKEKANMYF